MHGYGHFKNPNGFYVASRRGQGEGGPEEAGGRRRTAMADVPEFARNNYATANPESLVDDPGNPRPSSPVLTYGA